MPRWILVWWAYAVELIAAGATLTTLCMWLGATSVIQFMRDVAVDVATLFGAVMFAASLAFLWTFYSKSDTEFYRWLDGKGAFTVYLSATGFSIFISLISTLSLIALKKIQNDSFALVATYILLLALINLYTLVKNVFGLMQLNAKFNQTKHKDSEPAQQNGKGVGKGVR